MILSTTATSVPSESSFSDWGNMLDDSINRMTPEYFQELIFYLNILNSENQHKLTILTFY
jgi:hypothetical protein